VDDSGGDGVDYHRFPLGLVPLRRPVMLVGGVRRRLLDLARFVPDFERRRARPLELNLFLWRRGSGGGSPRRVHAEGEK